MGNSILNDTKKYLGLADSYKAFDPDVLLQINSALMSLVQIGVGPALGVVVEDESAEWQAVIGEDTRLLGAVKNYVYMKAKLGFDPPQTSHLLNALQEQIKEIEWRLEVARGPVILSNEELVIDGGGA